MNKTPVSILQEMMVKQGIIPDYELIHDGGGRHVNTFIYQVTCDDLRATGTGRCKKDAKHEAAKAMLTEIAAHRNYPQLPPPSSPVDSPSRSSFHSNLPKISANVPFFNAIGELQDLCAENNLQEPAYVLIRDVGPPHARVFTIQCIISSFVENGVATTKKQAKHDAAKKMLERINDLVNFGHKENEKECSNSVTETEIMNRNAKDYYCTLIKSKKINLGIKLSEYHTDWRDSLETDKCSKLLENLNCILPNKFSNDTDQCITDDLVTEKLSKLKCILSEVNITISTKDINAEEDYFVKAIELDTCPAFTQIAKGKNELEASWKALIQIINSLKLLLL